MQCMHDLVQRAYTVKSKGVFFIVIIMYGDVLHSDA
jgi:hypothetical protein